MHTQARAQTFWGAGAQKKKGHPSPKLFMKLKIIIINRHYAANFVKEINECCG